MRKKEKEHTCVRHFTCNVIIIHAVFIQITHYANMYDATILVKSCSNPQKKVLPKRTSGMFIFHDF